MQRGSPFVKAVEAAVTSVLESEGYELVLVEHVARPGVLRFFIDAEAGQG